MASPYLLTNVDLQMPNLSGQAFNVYLAFLNPISVTTNWVDPGLDAQGNALPVPNFDTAAQRVAPYAPVANLGPNRIGFVNEPLYFDGTRSCQRFDIPVTTYVWSVSGNPSNTTLYHNTSQLSVVWGSPGIFTVSLLVVDRGRTNIVGTRQVMIYDDRQSALPGMIQLSGPQGSLSSGGWQCQINTVNSQFTLFPPDALPTGTYQPVVIMAETSYEVAPGVWINRTLGPNGQFNPGSFYTDPRILFDGYIQTGSVHQDVDKDTLSFTMAGPQLLLNDAKTHTLGYYNCSYTSINAGVPVSCNPSPMGSGFMVGGLMTTDIVQSLLQYHSNILTYHDLHQWNAGIPTNPYLPGVPNAYYNLTYSTLSVNEGTIWTNLQELAQNEFATVYCDRDGSIRVGPQVNYRGQEFWAQPQLLGGSVAGEFVNFIQDLGYNVGDTLAGMPANIPMLPAQPMPVQFVHPWGPQTAVPAYGVPFQRVIDAGVVNTRAGLVGPPILCAFSDIPILDPGLAPTVTNGYFPGTLVNWPQDLSVYPITFDVQENYTGKASLVKLIGTLAQNSSIMTSWFPQSSFTPVGNGSGSIVTATLPAGNWIVDESHVLPDVTSTQSQALVTNYWWEIARRYYYAQNINYQVTVALSMATFASLGDIASVTRQNNTLGPHWLGKLFYVDSISYSIDMTNRIWTTQYSLTEVTSAQLTPITPPLQTFFW